MKNTNTFGVHFTIRQNKEMNGKSPIYARVSVNKSRVDLSIKQSLPVSDWNIGRGCAKPKNEELKLLNSYLEEVRFKLVIQYQELKLKENFITTDDVKNAYLGVSEKSDGRTLLWLVGEHNLVMKKVLRKGSLKNYFTTERYLQNFLKDCHGGDILLSKLNYAFLTSFEHYVRMNPLKLNDPCLPNGYAHNDYWHKRPLQDALLNGFTYVEADIYLRRGKLIVAHILPCLKRKRTLEELYPKPLFNNTCDDSNNGSGINKSPVTLMIDIKTNASKTYKALVLLLEKYKSILSGYENGKLSIRNVTIVITGHKPNHLIKTTASRLVFLDENLQQTGTDSSENIYPIASCKYNGILKWKGKGEMPDAERRHLEYFVNRAHLHGRKVRLWGSPENKAVCSELLKCNVDLINTDKLIALKNYLIGSMLLVAKKG